MNFPRGCRGVVHNCRSMLFLWFAQDGPTTVWLCCVSRGMDPQLPLSRSLRLHPSGRCLRWEMLRGCWCWYVFLCCDNACEFILTCQGVTVRHSHLPLPSVVSECFGMVTWSRNNKRKRRTAVPFWHIRQWQYSMRMSVLIVESPELNACSCQVSVGQNTGLNERLVDEWVIDIGKLGCTALPLSESNHTRSYANKQSMSTSWCFTFPCQVESNLTRMYQDSDERSFHVFHFEMQILVRRWDTVDICRSACEIFCDLLSTHDTEILGMSIAWSSWPPTDQEMIQKSCWSVAGCPMNGGAEKNLPRVDRWKPSGCHRLQFPGPRAPDRFVLVISCHYCILYIYIYIVYMIIYEYLILFDHICTMHNAQYIQVSDRIPSVPISCRQM